MSAVLDPNEKIEAFTNRQSVTMYIVLGIDENTTFKTRTKKEIGKIEWVPLVDLPNWDGPPRKGAAKKGGDRKYFNITPYVGGIKKFLKRKGLNVPRRGRNAQRGAGGRGGGGKQQGGRDLQPFPFDAGPSAAGRELKPFDFDDGPKPVPTGTPMTGLDMLLANVAAPPPPAPSAPHAQVQHQTSEDRNDDDMLARLLGNVGTVDATAPAPTPPAQAHPSAPPPDTKQARLLQVIQPRSPQAAAPTSPPGPPRSQHQNNLLAVISSPTKQAPALPAHTSQAHVINEDEERAQRQRALLESTLGYPSSPSSTPGLSRGASHGPSPLPVGYSPHGPSPMPQNWSPYPPSQASPYPPSQPPQSAQPTRPPPVPQHTRPQQYDYGQQPQQLPQSPPRQAPQNDHQRNLLGALFAKPSQAQTHNASPANYGQPAHQPSPSNYGQPTQPPAHVAPPQANYAQHGQPPVAAYGQPAQQPNPNYHPTGQAPAHANFNQPAQQPNANYPPAQRVQPPPGYYGHTRQLSGGLPGQPGQGRPIGGPLGLPGQPGQPLAPPGWNMQQQFQFPNQGFPGQPGQPGQVPPPHQMGPGYQHYSPQQPAPGYQPQQQQYQAQQQYQQPQQQLHAQQVQQVQQHTAQQLQQQQPNPPARAAQTSPAMHQPVARPPVSGSLLGLAAGR
jgi:mRNA-decapping enzyme subunit 2